MALLALCGVAEAVPSKKLSGARAQAAVERTVEREYPRTTRDRTVLASCRRTSNASFRCVYEVYGNFGDGFEDPDAGPVYATGRGTVRKRGRYLDVRVSRPCRSC